jgi:hypothetical protein
VRFDEKKNSSLAEVQKFSDETWNINIFGRFS